MENERDKNVLRMDVVERIQPSVAVIHAGTPIVGIVRATGRLVVIDAMRIGHSEHFRGHNVPEPTRTALIAAAPWTTLTGMVVYASAEDVQMMVWVPGVLARDPDSKVAWDDLVCIGTRDGFRMDDVVSGRVTMDFATA